MSYISPKQRFIQECIAEDCDVKDALWLAELEFDTEGDPRPGSIYATYRKPS